MIAKCRIFAIVSALQLSKLSGWNCRIPNRPWEVVGWRAAAGSTTMRKRPRMIVKDHRGEE